MIYSPHDVSIMSKYFLLTCPLVLNRRTFSAKLVLKERLTRDVWSFCSSGVKGVVIDWLRICSTISGDDAGLVQVEQLLARCSSSLIKLLTYYCQVCSK